MIKLKDFLYIVEKWWNVVVHVGTSTFDYEDVTEMVENYFIVDLEVEQDDETFKQVLHLTLTDKV